LGGVVAAVTMVGGGGSGGVGRMSGDAGYPWVTYWAVTYSRVTDVDPVVAQATRHDRKDTPDNV
jgi:hypothetical protein